MFCKVVFVKIVHLASWEDTQFPGIFIFGMEICYLLNICGTRYILSVHEIIILVYKLLVKPCMNVEEIIFYMLFSWNSLLWLALVQPSSPSELNFLYQLIEWLISTAGVLPALTHVTAAMLIPPLHCNCQLMVGCTRVNHPYRDQRVGGIVNLCPLFYFVFDITNFLCFWTYAFGHPTYYPHAQITSGPSNSLSLDEHNRIAPWTGR